MAALTELVRDGPVTAPLSYQVPQSGELIPATVEATLNGASATQSFYATLQVLDPNGRVMGSYISSAIAAGGSATVTWFPGAEVEDEAAATEPGVAVETLFMHSTQSAGVTSSTVLTSGQTYTITAQGTYSLWNAALTVGTPNADAMFPTSDGDPRTSTQVGLDPECAFAVLSGGGVSLGHSQAFVVNLGSGFQHIEPSGGPFTTPQPNYLYTYTVTGQGLTATFKISENIADYADNYGSFRITIQNPANAGGSGTLVPAADTTLNGDVLTVVTGVPAWHAPTTGLASLYDSGYLGADAATIDTGANGIASGHFCLTIFAYLRSTGAVTSDNVLVTLNNDSTGAYDMSRIQNANTTLTGANAVHQTSGNIGNCPGANAAAGIFGALVVMMPAYDGTSNSKAAVVQSGSAQDTAAGANNTVTGFAYESSSAISRLAIAPSSAGAKFKAGSRLVIYGMQ